MAVDKPYLSDADFGCSTERYSSYKVDPVTVLAIFKEFKNSFLGAYPNDGAANTASASGKINLAEGLLYWNTTSKKFRAYTIVASVGSWIDYDTTAQEAKVTAIAKALEALNSADASAASATSAALDRVQTGLDRTAVAADRVQTNLDRIATDAAAAEADALLTEAAVALAAGTVSDLVGTRIYTGRAALDADLVPADGLYALVIGDATAVNNDLYRKIGATTVGSWSAPLGLFAAASAEAKAAADAAASAMATVAAMAATNGLGQQRRNLYDPAIATSGYYIDATGALVANAAYVASAAITVSTANTYRFKKAAAHVAFKTAGGALIGSVSAIAADTEFTPPAGTATMRFSMTISTATKPKQMLCPTSISIAAWEYVAPFVDDTASGKRTSLASAVQVGRSYQQQGIQIFDAAACTDGYALNQATGGLSANASYSMSAYIAVDRSTVFSHGTGPMIGFYAEDQTYLGYSSPAAGTFDAVALFPDACWIRVQLLTSTKAAYKLGYGSTPASATFGYATQTVVDLTALQKGRVASAAARADDANVLNPNKVVLNRGITASTGSTYTLAAWSVTGLVEVNPGDYFSTSLGGNAGAFYDSTATFQTSPMNAAQTFTASITDNVMDVTVAPANGVFVGQRISYTGKTPGNILRQLTGTANGVGTYLMSQRQGTPIASAATFSAGPYFDANQWHKVPSGAYFAQWQANTLTGFQLGTVKQGRAALVEACTFTADIATNTLTVSAVASGQLTVGSRIIGANMTTCKITALGTGTGGTGTYMVDVAQTVASQTMYAGADPAVTSRAFGGGGTSVAQNWSGALAYVQGDSQVNNGQFQPTMAAVSGLIITSQGTPGRAMAGGATAIASVDLTAYALVINDHMSNDYAGNRALGTIADDKTVASFYGDMAKWIDGVWGRYPSKPIVFFGATRRFDVVPSNGLGLTIEDYDNAMNVFCRRHGIPFRSMLTGTGFSTLTKATFLSDDIHYGAAGGVLVGRIKGNFINTDV